MKLYTLPGTAALAANIAIAWSEAPIEVICLKRGQQKEDDFLAINPKGQVPVLLFDDGDALTETIAILEYISAAHGGPASAPFARATKLGRKESEALSYLSSTIHAAFRCHFAPYLFANGAKNEKAVRHKAYWRLDGLLEKLDAEMRDSEGPWMLSQKSHADAYLYIIGRWLETTPMDISDYPQLLTHQREMEKDEAVLLALKRQGMEPADHADNDEE